jgi:glycyl-tRNA synthetase
MLLFQVLVDAMSSKQLEEEVEVRGPPASKAFDDEGNPTKVFFLFSLWSSFGHGY